MRKIYPFIVLACSWSVSIGQNVGIGVTNPAQKLEVAGWIELGNQTEGTTGSAGTIRYNTTGKIQFHNGTAWFDIYSANNWDDDWLKVGGGLPTNTDQVYHQGNVMIGATTAPAASLHISNAASEQIRIQSSGAEADIHYVNNNTTWQVGTNNGGNGTNSNQFFIYDSGYRLTVQKGTGNVGIGNAAPAYSLETAVGGTISVNDGSVRNVRGFYMKDWDDDSGGSDDTYRLLARDGAFMFYNGGVAVGGFGNGTIGTLGSGNLLVSNNATVNGNGVVLGTLGVGTASPGSKMEVQSSGTTELRISSTSGFGPAQLSLYSDRGSANEWRPGFVRSADAGSFTGRLDFYTNGTGSANKIGEVHGMTIRNGRVGIGELTPASTLEVAGDIRITGNGSNLVYENDFEVNNEWRLIYVDDFQSTTDSWVAQTITSTGNNGITREQNGYAGYSYWVRPTNGNDRALKKYYDMTGVSYSEIKVEFTYYFLDSWDNENAWVGAGSTESFASGIRPSTLWAARWEHDWGDPRSGTNFSFYGNSGWSDAATTAVAIFRNNFGGTGFWLFVGSSLDDPISDETFAIDNVRVYVR